MEGHGACVGRQLVGEGLEEVDLEGEAGLSEQRILDSDMNDFNQKQHTLGLPPPGLPGGMDSGGGPAAGR